MPSAAIGRALGPRRPAAPMSRLPPSRPAVGAAGKEPPKLLLSVSRSWGTAIQRAPSSSLAVGYARERRSSRA
jgi:hypothetical protein